MRLNASNCRVHSGATPSRAGSRTSTADGGQTFQNLPELRPAGSGQQIVQSRLLRPSGDPVKLDFVVRPGGDGWRILDVLADGSISRLAVLRSDFRRLLSDGTGAQLTATLDRKVADLSRGALA